MNRVSLTCALIPTFALLACGDLTGDAAEPDQHPETRVASLQLDDGSQIDFYASDDEILMHARAASLEGRAVADVELAANKPVDVYLTLSGGAEVPTALLEAQTRVELLRTTPEQSESDAVVKPGADQAPGAETSGLGISRQPLSADRKSVV